MVRAADHEWTQEGALRMGLDASRSRELYGPPESLPSESWSNRALSIGVEEQGAALILRLIGEFDWTCVGRVEAALERVPEAVRQVVFDLRGVSFLDSGGLKAILRANERAASGSFDVVVVRPRGLANRVFTLTRAGKQLAMVDQPPSRTAEGGA